MTDEKPTLEAYLSLPCEGCGEVEKVFGDGTYQLKATPKDAKLYFLRPTPAVHCEKCGWHEPVESDDVTYLLMMLTKSKDVRELFAWVAARIAEGEGLRR